jgi:FHA domain/von Willebrand factor type A domain
MPLQRIFCRSLTALVTACCISPALFAWHNLTGEIDIHCEQRNETFLDCHYRPLFPGSVSNVRARSGTMELAVKDAQNAKEDVTAIYFLIDTSDPARQNVIDKNIQQIERLLIASKPAHRLGLASFDKKLRILAPIGSSKSQITASTKEIKAEGKTTELFRSLLLTIEKLSRTNASRKAIYLFSDGQAEDKAYFHSDVVKAARRKGVVINGIGFPRSVSLSVALQTLRRLSEETGGIFTEADSNYDLADKFYRQPYNNIDKGEDFTVDITSLVANALTPRAEVTLDFTTDIGNLKIKVPVSLPLTNTVKPTMAVASPIAAVPVQPEIRVVTPISEPEKIDFWLWYGLPIALVFLFLIALITVILIYRKQPDKSALTSNTQQQSKPFAYLVSQEDQSKRYPILNTTWRIGRSRDNELSLDDSSVSRRHAEIHRYNNGNFFIMDMQSLNGIYVNDEQVSNKKLQEGDMIEIGDIYLRFTHQPEDYQLEDDTAIQKTKTPVH